MNNRLKFTGELCHRRIMIYILICGGNSQLTAGNLAFLT